MKYEPNPIDTSDIALNPELLALAELLAKNTHDVWARERIAQGWKYGPSRQDSTKEHPCLIPYEELPEEEKVYDRNTSIETLKVLCALGYTITPNNPEGA